MEEKAATQVSFFAVFACVGLQCNGFQLLHENMDMTAACVYESVLSPTAGEVHGNVSL